ncbi:amidohydrolase family protein [Cochleicola gelatinilyticus]|uniref:Amidohydrolase n=1 Tax=Cochleicola gelatinilyticus TaxID=1763537 RepID=A0A167HGI9_9FLAO|nr:amidohydrolase family protein [Cochleicola gelatinilyticus]OAB78581.1 amidohydrolase [Cochleicola gelatinilyticus]
MKKATNILLAAAFSLGITAFAQQTPAPVQKEVITITGATAHTGDGNVIENSVIVFENGTITAMGGTEVATQGRVINAQGKHIYPGFIAPAKPLGLVEINAVRASDDQDELGSMIPQVRSLIAYNAESKVVESLRPNGVLLGQITPQGGRISGSSSIVQFDAWNWEDAAIKVDDGIHLNWPSSFRRGRWWEGEERGYKPNKEYNKQIDELKQFVVNSNVYQNDATETNEAMKAMKGLFDGSKKLYVHVNSEKEIIDAVTTAKENGIKEVVIVGGYEAYKIIPFLKQNNIPVLVQHTHNLPDRDDDNYDLPYKLPKLLVDGGLLVGLENSGTSNFQVRNLPFYAGQVAGQGMDKETALQLISGNTAKILGIDANYGTLAVGKSATLFISEGDALDMRTNQLTHAFIDGREISLETHQTELWKRYMEKYSRK